MYTQWQYSGVHVQAYGRRVRVVRAITSFIICVMPCTLTGLTACASRSPALTPGPVLSSPAVVKGPEDPTNAATKHQGFTTVETLAASEEDRLARLWRRRSQQRGIADYPIGPGDVLEINVTAVEELTNRTVRVSGEGTIALPFVGEVAVAGLTEKQIRSDLHSRLEKYMHSPQINLLVKDYRSRQVAVVGAVEKPGLYNLASTTDTILDVLTLAGGMKADAAPRISLIPAESGETTKEAGVAAPMPAQLASSTLPMVLKTGDPIVIDLQNLAKGGNQMYLSMPARPGDVIMVSGSGEVLVAGWVEKPASYKITPGLTLLGAIQAAGGPHFAADQHTVKVIRSGKDGDKRFFQADLDQIKNGQSRDVAVQDGDVIEVASSTAKLVPYGFYNFVTKIFNAGFYMR